MKRSKTMELHEIGIHNVDQLKKENRIPEVEGYIIELLRSYKTKTKTLEVWESCWNKKIYKTIEIAEDAYRQRPDCYKINDLQVRIVTMYRGDNYKTINNQ